VPHDPNWFYSTLAQSAAAIVGLAGGFLVNRLLVRRSEVGVEREPLRGDYLNLRNQIENQRLTAQAAVESIDSALALVDAGMESARPTFTSDQLRTLSHQANWSPPQAYPPPSDEDITGLREARSVIGQFAAALPNPDDLSGMLQKREPLVPLDAAWLPAPEAEPRYWDTIGVDVEHFWDSVWHQREYAQRHWQSTAEAYTSLSARLAALRGRLIPRSMYFLLAVLTFLVGGCVAMPMFFLTAEGSGSKSLLLAFFLVAGSAFVGYLVYEVRHINRAADLAAEWF
jgi:hypothetical protein